MHYPALLAKLQVFLGATHYTSLNLSDNNPILAVILSLNSSAEDGDILVLPLNTGCIKDLSVEGDHIIEYIDKNLERRVTHFKDLSVITQDFLTSIAKPQKLNSITLPKNLPIYNPVQREVAGTILDYITSEDIDTQDWQDTANYITALKRVTEYLGEVWKKSGVNWEIMLEYASKDWEGWDHSHNKPRVWNQIGVLTLESEEQEAKTRFLHQSSDGKFTSTFTAGTGAITNNPQTIYDNLADMMTSLHPAIFQAR